MRFLTRDWLEDDFDEFTQALYLQVYMRHLEDIAGDLPEGARALAALSMGYRLNGAEVSATSLDEKTGQFRLVLKVETIGGEMFLEVEYSGVDPDGIDLEPFENAETLLTDEFDIAPDARFEHRMLFEPDGEGNVIFKDVVFRTRQTKTDEEE